MTETAAWTLAFWNALAVYTWSFKRVGDDAELWGWHLRVCWEASGEGGRIIVSRPPARWSRRTEVVESIAIYRNFDPVREARDVARTVYGLDVRRTA